jgi:chaperonin GroEL (HSP60 family)
MDNAGEPSDYRLKQVQLAKHGYGFNLRDMTEEPVDLAKQGIWDATKAVVQTVENATSAAVAILRVGTFVGAVEGDVQPIKE